MKWRGPIISVTLHGLLAYGVVWVLEHAPEELSLSYMSFADVPEPKEPEPPQSTQPERKKERPKPAPKPRLPPARERSQTSQVEQAQELPPAGFHDFGLVLDGADGIPSAAMVLPRSALDNGRSGARPRGTTNPSTKKPEPKPKGPPPCHEKLVAPKPVHRTNVSRVMERYTRPISGRLVLRLDVSEQGRVHGAKVLSSVDSEVDQEVLALVRQWRFEPATRCGVPQAGSYTLAIRFEG